LAAVDGDFGAGDEGRFIAAQEDDRPRYGLGHPRPLSGMRGSTSSFRETEDSIAVRGENRITEHPP
jgi:hypothetical protein